MLCEAGDGHIHICIHTYARACVRTCLHALIHSAGYDVVIVETVGIGQATQPSHTNLSPPRTHHYTTQSELEVDHTVDAMMLLMPPASGDELQVCVCVCVCWG